MKKDFKQKIKMLATNNKGVGIKELAMALGGIVVVGLVIQAVGSGSFLTDALDDIWTWVTSFVTDNIKK